MQINLSAQRKQKKKVKCSDDEEDSGIILPQLSRGKSALGSGGGCGVKPEEKQVELKRMLDRTKEILKKQLFSGKRKFVKPNMQKSNESVIEINNDENEDDSEEKHKKIFAESPQTPQAYPHPRLKEEADEDEDEDEDELDLGVLPNDNSVLLLHNEEGDDDGIEWETRKAQIPYNLGEDRKWKFSVAIPQSLISGALTQILRSYVAGQVARAATIFGVEEIIIYNDHLDQEEGPKMSWKKNKEKEREKGVAEKQSDLKQSNYRERLKMTSEEIQNFFRRNLEYFTCPQYLRKALIEMNSDLKCAGVVPPLDGPHQMRRTEWTPFREGVIMSKKTKPKNKLLRGQKVPISANQGRYVDCGLAQKLWLESRDNVPGQRVTVRTDQEIRGSLRVLRKKSKSTTGRIAPHRLPVVTTEIVESSAPYTEERLFWGYKVKTLDDGLSSILEAGDYDLILGTSERGEHACKKSEDLRQLFTSKEGFHCLMILGNVRGLETTMKTYTPEQNSKIGMWLNTCPYQTSRTIRTEEALFISLSCLHNLLLQ
eukprot:GHVP01020553.1.p1 GENE.GHVP01020553.1~~GHVP01020553.1.p1  ORF type:complete len:541 (-),score=126.03 GHVP01020553.1:124-1746(-)